MKTPLAKTFYILLTILVLCLAGLVPGAVLV